VYITHVHIVTKNNGFPYVVIPQIIAFRLHIMPGQYVNIHSRGDSIIKENFIAQNKEAIEGRRIKWTQ
jgi:hypothetical protein